MSSVIVAKEEPQDQSTSCIRGYVEWSQHLAKVGFLTLDSYSPKTAALVSSSLKQVDEWTPEGVKAKAKDVVEYSVDGLDSYVDAAGTFVGRKITAVQKVSKSALEQTKDFPVLLQKLKERLTPAQIQQILSEVTAEAGNRFESFSESLPSRKLQDQLIKGRVKEIVDIVMSQPELLKNKASELAGTVKETFSLVGYSLKDTVDVDQDGKVSVKDLYSSTAELGQSTLEYCTKAVSDLVPFEEASLKMSAFFESFLEQAQNNSIVDGVKKNVPWEAIGTLNGSFAPLWAAAAIVIEHFSIYASNVQSKYKPFSPHVTQLISKTSVLELPFEINQMMKTGLGFVDDKERALIVNDGRTFFWALIDISFIFWAKNETKGSAENAEGEVSEIEQDENSEQNRESSEQKIHFKEASSEELTKAFEELSAFQGLSMP